VQANAAKLRCPRNGVPDSEYLGDTEFPPPTMRVAAREVAAQGRGEGATAQEEAEHRADWVLDGSESMSGSEGSIAGSGDSELDRPDGIEGDCWSEAEAYAECDSELDEFKKTRSLSLGLDRETLWKTAESILPGNSRQMASQTPRRFT
jgi:hypothetical protein